MYVRPFTSSDHPQLDQLSHKIAGQGVAAFDGDINSYFLLLKDQTVVGMACVEDFGTFEKDEHHIACRSYLLQNFGISPSERKKGYGTFFFREICKQLKYHAKTCRIEWQIGGNSLAFWKHATKNKVDITPWCGNQDNCKQCCEGFDVYHISFLADADFAVLVLNVEENKVKISCSTLAK